RLTPGWLTVEGNSLGSMALAAVDTPPGDRIHANRKLHLACHWLRLLVSLGPHRRVGDRFGKLYPDCRWLRFDTFFPGHRRRQAMGLFALPRLHPAVMGSFARFAGRPCWLRSAESSAIGSEHWLRSSGAG